MKRVYLGVGASLAVGLLSASGAFASSLDYAMSVGQVEMGDTVNYVIEATSDGGYIAGGQTIQCFKIEYGGGGIRGGAKAIDWVGSSNEGWINRWVEGEVVPMADCEEYYANAPQPKGGEEAELKSYRQKVDAPISTLKAADRDGEPTVNFYDYCERPHRGGGLADAEGVSYMGGNGAISAIMATAPVMRLTELDSDAYYTYTCVDYAAKFKQDGTKEWLQTIRNGDMPVAVGETNSDYRLLTRYGMLYTFAKTNGEEGISTATGVWDVDDAIINQNGTTVVTTNDDIVLLGANGSVTKEMPEVDNDTEWSSYYPTGSEVSKPLVRTDDGFIVMKYSEKKTGEDEDGNDIWEETVSIVKVSNDLSNVETLLEIDGEEMSAIGWNLEVVSADQDGNIAMIVPIRDEDTGRSTAYLVTMDQNGNGIAAKPVEEIIGDTSNPVDELPLFVDNLTLVDTFGQKLIRLTPELEEIDNYPLVDGEMIYDATPLTDGSLAAVGRSSTSTDNYTVDGAMNGTYLRLAAAKASGTSNPQTADDVNILAISGAMATLVAAGVAMLISKRR